MVFAEAGTPYGTIAEQGILGAACLLLMGAIVWLVRQYLHATKEYRDSIERVTANQIVANREVIDKTVSAQKETTDKFIELQREQNVMLQTMHDRALEAVRGD